MSGWELQQKKSQPEFWSQVVLLHHLQEDGGDERQRLRYLCRLCTVTAQPTQLLCTTSDSIIVLPPPCEIDQLSLVPL